MKNKTEYTGAAALILVLFYLYFWYCVASVGASLLVNITETCDKPIKVKKYVHADLFCEEK